MATWGRRLRAAGRLVRVAMHVGHGMAIVALRWRTLDAAGRQARIGWWAAKLLRLLGLQPVVEGGVRSGAVLLLANHVSWLDILAIHAACPRARFVSKADVRQWPLLGWLVGAVGTLFIERERKRDALRVVHQMAAALERGDAVAVFPEGTTGDGAALLPFHANLLQAAIATGVPAQPLVLRYAAPGERFSPVVAWLGETTLIDSLWSVACADGLQVHIRALPPLGTRHADRRALALHVRTLIDQALHPDHNASQEMR
ncbi:1-acyl-sn-glycerol-3-phosphate acyltransferase [Aquincola sp. S2]|uniref:1-acyl-sn-glycerol-3-phosphate acyltransferase n=1 Tax=Pseudaquabacterium terrae TaxID=2732868 RepID=A0ABX2ECA0_9BURK|nr:lysophospholipid acyltransferase family protein [Aquabacterium terrae]NRF66754.1 1-acyl-sn-glycerol-3-phosphate acyltransferase [Aquabacterium terrae]